MNPHLQPYESALFAPPPQERAEPASKRVLVLDTDPGIRWALEKGLKQTGFIINVVSNLGEALRAVREEEIDAVVLEIQPEAGLTSETLALFIAAPSAPRVLCISVDSEPHVVIDCMRRGAADFLPKPFSLAEVRTALSRILAVENGATPERRLTSAPRGASGAGSYLIGISPVMQELRETIEQVAKTDLNCLLRGESGTGKDMVAREIHRLSRRHDKPFVKVNCTALPEQLLESELFGYEKGAFTGAVTSKPGRFELAHKGIIFLDEIGDMQPSLQAKLLQVIEHKEFTKLGGRRHITVDVQIVAATNANLEQRTKEGAFRDDLYFRLNEVCVWVPTLSARKEDVPLLVRHFIKKHQHSVDGSNIDITGEDLTALAEHDWPGNVRELESTVKRWLALGKKMLPTARPGVMRAPARPAPVAVPPPMPAAFDEPAASSAADDRSESEVLLDALERNQWNRRKAADDLGMSYQTLRRRIEKYGLDQPR